MAAIFGLSGYCDGVEHAQISVLQKKTFDKPIVAAFEKRHVDRVRFLLAHVRRLHSVHRAMA